MPVVRLAAISAAVIVLAACGAERRVHSTPTAAPASPNLRFVVAPSVTFHGDGTAAEVAVRVDRPLRHDLGHPAQYKDEDAYLVVPGAGPPDRLVGMFRDPVYPTCYWETVSLKDTTPPVIDGRPIEVSLVLSETERITGTAVARKLADGDHPRVATTLGCPNRAPGLPRVRRCHGEAPGSYSISVLSARGTTCRRGLHVLRRAAHDATSGRDCYRDLCLRGDLYLGYRCRAALAGEAYWDIACRRGKAEIRGSTAD